MSDPIASKWNARYAYASKQIPAPTDVLVNGAEYLPESGVAVDIACGLGGNAFYLASKGFSVHAWDISSAAIASIQEQMKRQKHELLLVAEQRDVVAEPPIANSVDVIVVGRFLDRGLCGKLSDALRPGGVLFYQTFTAGLSNPEYLLANNELPSLFPSLTTCYSHESDLDEQGFSEAQFVGRKG